MEPNVDRMQWSVVVLLAAIVIGGVVLLAFPRISGKIANNMDDTVNKAFKGDSPSWIEGSGSEDNKTDEDKNKDEFFDEVIFDGRTREDMLKEAGVQSFDKNKIQNGIVFKTKPASNYNSKYNKGELTISGIEIGSDFNEETLIIPKEIDGKKIVGIGGKSSSDKEGFVNKSSSLKNIYLGDNLEYVFPIASWAGDRIKIDNTIVSGPNLREIKEDAFNGTKAKNYIPALSNEIIEKNSFDSTAIKNVYVPESVKSISEHTISDKEHKLIIGNSLITELKSEISPNSRLTVEYIKDSYQFNKASTSNYAEYGVDKVYLENNPSVVKYEFDSQGYLTIKVPSNYRAHTLVIPNKINGKEVIGFDKIKFYDFKTGKDSNKPAMFNAIYIDTRKTDKDNSLNPHILSEVKLMEESAIIIGDNVVDLGYRTFNSHKAKIVVMGKNVQRVGSDALKVHPSYKGWDRFEWNGNKEITKMGNNVFGRYIESETSIKLPASLVEGGYSIVSRGKDFTIYKPASAKLESVASDPTIKNY